MVHARSRWPRSRIRSCCRRSRRARRRLRWRPIRGWRWIATATASSRTSCRAGPRWRKAARTGVLKRGPVARGAREAACGSVVFGEPRGQLHGAAQRLRGSRSALRREDEREAAAEGRGAPGRECWNTRRSRRAGSSTRASVSGVRSRRARRRASRRPTPLWHIFLAGRQPDQLQHPGESRRGDAQLHRVQHRGRSGVHRCLAVQPAEPGHGDTQLDLAGRAGGQWRDSPRSARAPAARPDFQVFASSSTDMVADVVGYFTVAVGGLRADRRAVGGAVHEHPGGDRRCGGGGHGRRNRTW